MCQHHRSGLQETQSFSNDTSCKSCGLLNNRDGDCDCRCLEVTIPKASLGNQDPIEALEQEVFDVR